jgi:Fe2+ or Zn2+ uptake regulation protein
MACGRIIDFEYEGYTRLDVPEAIAKKFTVLSRRVILKGFCDTCTPTQTNKEEQWARPPKT